MTDFRKTNQYESAKKINNALQVFKYMRIFGSLSTITSLFLFIWIDFILACKICLSCLLFVALCTGFYQWALNQLAKIYGKK